MKISNIRIERRNYEDEPWSYLTVDIECGFCKERTLWFGVPSTYEDWLTPDTYDGFVVAMLWPAMYYGEDIVVAGSMSERLYFNLRSYVQHSAIAYRPNLSVVKIEPKGFCEAEQISKIPATGFSAGVDSFQTFKERFVDETLPNRKVGAFFLFNIGSHGGRNPRAYEVWKLRYAAFNPLMQELGVPYIRLDGNIIDFYLKEWGYEAGVFSRSAVALLLQRKCNCYYLSATTSYKDVMYHLLKVSKADLASLAEHYLCPMLSTERIEICVDGAQYTRMQKVEQIKDLEFAKKYLNVCVNETTTYVSAKNCSKCKKCLRTMVELDCLGALDEFADVFDVNAYRKIAFATKCTYRLDPFVDDGYSKESLDYADANGMPFPSYGRAWMQVMPAKILRFPHRVVGKVLRAFGLR